MKSRGILLLCALGALLITPRLAAMPTHAQTLQELSRQLSAAVQASFPASGKVPEARDGHWTPMIR